MKLILSTLVLFSLLTLSTTAQTVDGFSYEKYPVKSIYKGTKAKLDFTSNPDAKFYRTRITEGYREGKVDFAGYYITIMWGCGTGCSSGAMVDARDGKIYWLPIDEGNNSNYCDDAVYGGKLKSRMYVAAYCEYNVENPEPNYTVFVWNESSKKFIRVSK